MISTARDYAVFCQMFLDRGRHGDTRILSERSVAAATSPQTTQCYTEKERRIRSSFYGLVWAVAQNGVYSHAGSDGTYAWVDPRHQIIGLVFTQTQGSGGPRHQFRRVVDAARQ